MLNTNARELWTQPICLHMYRNASRAKQPLIRYNVNIALDSFRFMNKSLASLIKTTTRFMHTDRHFTPEQQELLRRKEVYPYDYMSDFSKLKETVPPPKEAFDSYLNSTGSVSSTSDFDEMKPTKVSDEDYDHF